MALREAEKAAEDGEVPTGCVIVDAEGRILGRAHNQTNDSEFDSAGEGRKGIHFGSVEIKRILVHGLPWQLCVG